MQSHLRRTALKEDESTVREDISACLSKLYWERNLDAAKTIIKDFLKKILDTLFSRVYIITMTREFIITKEFDRTWKELGLNDDDLGELEIYLCKNPDCGDTLEGTGGVKKFRWALEGRGKSGGARIVYLDIVFAEHIYLLSAFPKNEKANLSKAERNQMKTIVIAIKNAEKEAQDGRK